MADEIIEELWRVKDEIAREHGYDVDRLAAYFRRRGREREAREARAAKEGGDSSAAGGQRSAKRGSAGRASGPPSGAGGSSQGA